VREFKNVLLVEMPNGDFADTIARSLFFDAYQFLFYTALKNSKDEKLAAIAEKSLKEVTYHLRFSKEWTIRLGDGTEESKQKIQHAINELWSYTGEMFDASEVEKEMQAKGIAPDIAALKPHWEKIIALQGAWFQKGGKTGIHTEYFGLILAELQYMQKTYPGCEW
jgi:ring-1,2-phenylacetyl-CoA epoxidase subunit PaaC